MGNHNFSALSAMIESKIQSTVDFIFTPVVMEFPAVAKTLDRFRISYRAGAVIVSLSLKMRALFYNAMYRTLLTEIKFSVREQGQELLYRLKQL